MRNEAKFGKHAKHRNIQKGEDIPWNLKTNALLCTSHDQSFIKKIVSLPSKATLFRLTKNLKIKPGINDNIFEMLKVKVENFTKDDKLSILCVDEMSIKANLYYAIYTDKIIGVDGREKMYLSLL